MDITKMTIKDLKEAAYNEGRKLEIARQNLIILNKRIQELELGQDIKEEVKEEEPK